MNRLDGNTVALLHEGECSPKKEPQSCKSCSSVDEDPVLVCDNLNHVGSCGIFSEELFFSRPTLRYAPYLDSIVFRD